MANTHYADVLDYFKKTVRKYKFFFIIVPVVLGFLGYMYGSLKTPKYTVKASVLIAPNSSSSGVLNIMSRFSIGNLLSGSSSVDNEQIMIYSHDVFQNMVENLNLNTTYLVKNGLRKTFQYPVAPVVMDCNPAIADTLMTSLKFDIKTDAEGNVDIVVRNGNKKKIAEVKNATLPLNLETAYGTFNFFFSDKYVKGTKLNETVNFTSYSAAAQIYQKLVKVSIANKRADAINLSMNHVSPELGKLILAQIIEAYNLQGSLEKRERGEATIKFIDARIDNIIGQLGQTENVLSEYKQKNNLSTIEADVEYSYTQHAELQSQIVGLESQLEVLKVISAQLTSGDTYNPLFQTPAIESMPNLSWLINNYNGLIIQRNELTKTAKEGNFALARLDEEIKSTRQNVITSIAQAQVQLNTSLKELKKKDDQSWARIGNIPMQEKNLRELMRNQSIQEEIYVFLLQQREQQAISSLNSLPRTVMIDKPYVLSEPAGLSKLVLSAIGIFGGIICTVLYFYFLYIWNIITAKEE